MQDVRHNMFERFDCIPEYTVELTKRVLSVRKGMQQVKNLGMKNRARNKGGILEHYAKNNEARFEARILQKTCLD